MDFHYHQMEGMYNSRQRNYSMLRSAMLFSVCMSFFVPSVVKLNIAERIFVLHNKKKIRNFCVLTLACTHISYEMDAKSSDSSNKKG